MHRALALLALLVVAACSSVDATPIEPTTTTTVPESSSFPVTIAADNGDVTIATRPQRIVSPSSTSTEMLFAIGAGDQVVAVDSFSTFPTDAPLDPALGAFDPNVEAIVDTHLPDLVVLSFDPGTVVASFEAIGIPVIVHNAAVDLDGTYRQIEQLGAATGKVAEAAAEVFRIAAEIDAIVAEVGNIGAGLTYFHELDESLYTATSSTFIGSVYGLLGLENIADPADADGTAWGYPQLSAEYLLEADPHLIFLADADCCGQSAETVGSRPGWDVLTAVRTGAIVELDEDIASRWGPRVVEFLRLVADSILALERSG
jgi:iron complex transport system substrate-binding protein